MSFAENSPKTPYQTPEERIAGIADRERIKQAKIDAEMKRRKLPGYRRKKYKGPAPIPLKKKKVRITERSKPPVEYMNKEEAKLYDPYYSDSFTYVKYPQPGMGYTNARFVPMPKSLKTPRGSLAPDRGPRMGRVIPTPVFVKPRDRPEVIEYIEKGGTYDDFKRGIPLTPPPPRMGIPPMMGTNPPDPKKYGGTPPPSRAPPRMGTNPPDPDRFGGGVSMFDMNIKIPTVEVEELQPVRVREKSLFGFMSPKKKDTNSLLWW